ncbi:MAG: ABC transporter permease [Eubacteriales bacterium]|nr:ABC transporter permease [Eubacteriales bacterium]
MNGQKSDKKRHNMSQFAIWIALLAMLIFFSVTTKGFLTSTNIFNVLRQVAVNGIAAVGATMVIITGGIDISQGAVMGVASVGCAMMINQGIHPALAVLLSLILGLVIGICNGFFVFEINLPPMIATLGVSTVLRGVAYIISGGLPVYGLPESFTVIGQGYLGPIPVPVIIMIVCFIFGYFLLEHTAFGRYIYGVGSNREASRLSGVNIRKIYYGVYALCSFLAALAGIVLLSRVNSGQPKAGENYDMDIITAVVLGGVSTTGGEGKIVNVIVGLLLIGVVLNGMVLMNISDYYQRVVKGAVLLLAISYDKLSQMKSQKTA